MSKHVRLPKWDLTFLIILVMGVFLLFFRLDHRPFWQDEAETACLARNVLHYGVPKAFDGVNLISQEGGREFDADYLWRWSPWLQMYVTAAAFQIGGVTTTAGRAPFALFAVACLILTYLLVRRNFGDPGWARMAAALLAFSVPFLLFSRQCRYYSLGALLVLMIIYAVQREVQSKAGSTSLMTISFGLLFYANYLLFLSFTLPFLVAVELIYPSKFPLKRLFKLGLGLGIIIIPGILLFRMRQQTSMVDIIKVPGNLEEYFADFFQFLIPLPVALYLGWRGRRIFRDSQSLAAGEKFILFLFLIIVGSIIILSLAPQSGHRYIVHLYPLCAIILGWIVCQAWRYHKFSGGLLALLLLFTNWLYLVPMDWLRIANRPNNSVQMLTYPNIPLNLFLRELCLDYPDLNRSLSQFFRTHARKGDTILTNYSDLPLQFYTSCRVIGSLQGRLPANASPEWVVKHYPTQWNRDHDVHQAETFIRRNVIASKDYKVVAVIYEDEIYGNIPDPYHHRFLPLREPLGPATIYRKISDN
ncbi:MAG: glycosyltransferase family 39 protein [Deltaproteobacteria bacterium]|nr:glycosyltransferase family 39 protein [Deltaproteobacteria bacterium]